MSVMRELKFRAWDKQEKQMMKVSAISLENKEIGVKDFRTYHFFRIKNIELMQYTGLKDKNGTEIYEGDIVQTPEYPGKIVYNEKYACFELWRLRSSNCFIALTHQQDIDMGDLEVIGNTHENPELSERK